MNYSQIAEAILKEVGGKENITGVTHCVTRLRFTVGDESKVNVENIKNVEKVINVVKSSGQFQVILGPIVSDVYNETVKLVGENLASAPVEEKKDKGIKAIGSSVLDYIVSCFTPAIPTIAGAGMVKVLVVLLTQFHLLESGSTTYTLLNTIGDGVFYFLPFIVAFNAARKLKVDPILAMALAAIVMHPNFTQYIGSEDPVTLFGIGVTALDYSAQAIPMIFGVWLLKYVDKFAKKVSPDIVSIFLRSMIDLLIVAPIIIFVVGPVSITLSNFLFALCEGMMAWGWLAVGINAALFPLMVLTGTHNATIPLIIQMFATQGFDPIFLVCGLAANIAEGGAACAVAVKTKNKTLKSTGFSATLSALLGITEPALYGVNLRMKKPFVGMLIGAFIGGCFAGFVGLQAPTFVTPSLLTFAFFVPQGKSIIVGILTLIVSFVAAFVATYLLGFKDLNEGE